MMKVLWFSNTPANADKYINRELKGSGGWLKSLDQELQKKIDLYIVFYCKKKMDPFQYKETKYFPIYKKKQSNFKSYIKYINANIVKEEDIDKYLEIIKEISPDIIHIHGTENPFGYINKYTDVPVIISIQGLLSSIYYKYVSGYYYINFNTSDSLLKKLLGIKRFKLGVKLIKNMADREQEVLKSSKYIIGRTDWDKSITRILSPTSLYFHNNEVLRSSFYKRIWNKNRVQKITIFSILGNNPYKGLEVILQTIEILKSHGQFEWCVAGISKNDTIVKSIKIKKANSKLDSLNYLGKLNEKEIIDNMLSSDIFVSASHIENSPNALSEAMLLGMPCIATYAGGTSSLLENNKEGVIVQEGDPFHMASAIFDLKRDFVKACAYGKNARKEALRRHNKDIIIDQLLRIYESVLSI